MLVFCEDCGAKHTVDDDDIDDPAFQFRCNVCDFLITAKSLPKRKVVEKPVDPTMELTCSHDILEFGLVEGEQEKSKVLILAARDGRKIDLTGAVDSELKGNVVLTPVSNVSFRVEIVLPSKVSGSCLTQYNGPGIVITDTISRYKKTVSLSFSRI
jgi:hypothetical protein